VVDRLKCKVDFPIGLNEGLIFEHLGFKIIGIASAHNTIERNDKGECKYMGFVVQFGKYSVYHSGDTLWWDGLEKIIKPYQVDIAFLPINGNKPERKVAGNMNADEAANFGKAINAKLVIPHHYNLFEFNTADPKEFEKIAQKNKLPYKTLQIGEGIYINK
jgi:L-ascorbate metabolism protein UlaG (beta-lactamase superfamily)